ncbi:MAG TPA: urease accessory UreF family protein [Polyangiales bacterium]
MTIEHPREPSRGASSVAVGSAPALLRLLWLASPALPIGAYAYSRGLEQAVARDWVRDEATLGRWIRGVLHRQLATLDAPIMLRVLRAARAADRAAIERWNDFLLAHRESREFALEDAQLGGSLARLLRELRDACAGLLPDKPGHATAFGVAAAAGECAERDVLAAFLFGFAENQITAALKCLSMGQTAGQRVLAQLSAELPALVEQSWQREDDQLGSFAPGLSLASALHETQYTRLFRS